MKILHTADWHLGRTLYGRNRYEEFSAFLDWLIETIESAHIDALIVAGDVFDTGTPSNRAQELYYRFLCRVSTSCCRHVVVISGNHDSPSFLDAPKALLKVLNVYVVGSVSGELGNEVVVLENDSGPELIVCAVPYLRDRDLRIQEPGENIDDKNAKRINGLRRHYSDVCAIAEEKKSGYLKAGYGNIPIFGMGHLFTEGGRTVEGDGVRELYVGSLAHIGTDVFPKSIDYLALGHLHVPQTVDDNPCIRYSGSPIPMGYGEATQEKKIVLVEVIDSKLDISELTIPCFRQLVRIEGTLDSIHAKLEELRKDGSSAWLEIEYTGGDVVSNLRDVLDEAIEGSLMEIRRIKNRLVMNRVINATAEEETLDDLNPSDVFIRCLNAHEVPESDRKELVACYDEIVKLIHEEDVNAE